ncbi:uncharacterized protein V2V93DRAFT_370349 [Kockiozyma suomiensis]|uniref:uncharacterized protein n=1 Tax=Kockiozyma suomiensis TaxID=1337062 RepID=UPI00334400BC
MTSVVFLSTTAASTVSGPAVSSLTVPVVPVAAKIDRDLCFDNFSRDHYSGKSMGFGDFNSSFSAFDTVPDIHFDTNVTPRKRKYQSGDDDSSLEDMTDNSSADISDLYGEVPLGNDDDDDGDDDQEVGSSMQCVCVKYWPLYPTSDDHNCLHLPPLQWTFQRLAYSSEYYPEQAAFSFFPDQLPSPDNSPLQPRMTKIPSWFIRDHAVRAFTGQCSQCQLHSDDKLKYSPWHTHYNSSNLFQDFSDAIADEFPFVFEEVEIEFLLPYFNDYLNRRLGGHIIQE